MSKKQIEEYVPINEGLVLTPEIEEWIEKQDRAMEAYEIKEKMSRFESVVGEEKSKEVYKSVVDSSLKAQRGP